MSAANVRGSNPGLRQHLRAGLVIPIIGALLLGVSGYYTVVDNREIQQTRATVIDALPTPSPPPSPKKKKKKPGKKKKKAGSN
jgi:hypothetical protein